ncbi:heptaprenyl diphosphate synthase component II [Jeotgalibacillus haloalkalitolerans]|uniref:Heptaprenyl diphosphate synthase component II n=1 Tax=Jeotgalibacillus haloalkalitolerans TaxID=3104292 RepID=A0ABU5KL83_9BACL|nr:heptaprenyl diphosphate synthase component II [Jeotgalibacillus sp. HH7-29]MDZ5712013.1 heptaprenyl diphosphate synthase component II [Jeotgalibacillus sp. HH7-29]
MKLTMLYSFLKTDIEEIEKELSRAIHSETALLKNASLHLLQAGGKRIRPVFVLLSAKTGQYDIHKVKNAAVALELIHMASLVHDDVIDNSDMRRGRTTIQAEWNNQVAMYTGDYMFARALNYMTVIDDPAAHRILSDAIVELCIGEIAQIQDKYRFNQSMKDYFRRIKRKTALLIAVSCQLGAVTGEASPDIQKRLYRFGYYVGMAYQITDDILDFTGTEKELGKPAGGDLLQGNITLPVFFAMENRELGNKIKKVHEDMPKDDLQQIIDGIVKSDAIKRSSMISQRYLVKALEQLDTLPASKAKKSLRDIAIFIGKRKY